MRADYRIFLDACVLANFGVCDVLLRLSERPRLIVPHWSAEVLEETRRTQIEKLGWPHELANSFRIELSKAFPSAEVTGYAHLLSAVTNDPKDRHVLAAAISGACPLIVTFNLKHFPAEALQPWGIAASHPQDYLLDVAVETQVLSGQLFRELAVAVAAFAFGLPFTFRLGTWDLHPSRKERASLLPAAPR